MEIVHQVHLWLGERSLLVKEEVVNLKYKRFGKNIEFKLERFSLTSAGAAIFS